MSLVLFPDCNRGSWRISACPLNVCLYVCPFWCYSELKETGLVVTFCLFYFSLVLCKFQAVGTGANLEICSLFSSLKKKKVFSVRLSCSRGSSPRWQEASQWGHGCVCALPWAADVWDSTFCVQMSVRWGRAVLDHAAGALSDTHRGTDRAWLSRTDWTHRGSCVVNMFREGLESSPHCRRIFVSISQLSARLWPLCLPMGTELSRENDLMKSNQGRNSCAALCLSGYVTLSSIPSSLSQDCSGQKVKGCNFSSGWCLCAAVACCASVSCRDGACLDWG